MKQKLLLAVVSIISTAFLVGGIAKAATGTTTTDTSSTDTTTTTSSTSPPRGGMRGQGRTELASLLGLTTAELQAKIDAGTPLYTIATQQGLTYSELLAKRQAAYETELDAMVKSGFITSAQRESFLSAWKERAASEPMLGMMGGHGKGFGHM